MIYLKLFINLFLAGCLSVGGYTVVSIITEIVKNFGNIDENMLVNFIAISESTPGPLAVNLATYIGTETAGILGAIVATFAITLPAFLIILGYAVFLKKFFTNDKTKFVLSVVRSCVIAIIMAVGLHLLINSLYLGDSLININTNCIYIMFILIFIILVFEKLLKKHISSITIIIIAAILGIAINDFL